jgi:hypothetical protein
MKMQHRRRLAIAVSIATLVAADDVERLQRRGLGGR